MRAKPSETRDELASEVGTLFRIAPAAALCKVSRDRLKKAVRDGKLPCKLTACGLLLVLQEDVITWKKTHCD